MARFRAFRQLADSQASVPRAPLDVPAIAGVPQSSTAWASVASTLTPRRCAQVIQDARRGDADAYLTLAEEIEERDLQYGAVLQTRKLALTGIEMELEPGDDSARADEIATEFRKQVVDSDHPAIETEDGREIVSFAETLFDLMDALGKGYSVAQPHWETSARQWNYRGFEWLDPRLFQFDPDTLRALRIKSPGIREGIRPLPGQFVTHYPKIKTGIRIRSGLAIPASLAYMAKTYTLADWLAFCEVYGMPMRVAKYDPETMTRAEITALKIAIANIGHDAAAIIPRGADIEVLDARRPPANGKNVFEGLANFWNAALAKIVLGQTMTTDDGSSRAQAEVHDDVRLDLRRADARSLSATVKAQIVAPWVRANYGDEAPVPNPKFPVDPPEDLKLFTEACLPWVERAGMKISAAQVRAKFGLDAPEGVPEDEILGLPAARATGDPVKPGADPAQGAGAQPPAQA